MDIVFCVGAGFAVALLAPWVHRAAEKVSGWIFALIPAAITAYLASYIPSVSAGAAVHTSYGWVPVAGADLAFHLDGLSLFFSLLVGGAATIVLAYSSAYVRAKPFAGRFYAFMLVFMGSMLGLVLADNVVTFYVFFELTSLSSFLLIGLEDEEAEARRAARQAFIVTNAGGLALLVGVILMGFEADSFTISTLLERGDIIRSATLYTPIVVLVAVGAFAKSAQIPFHFWLPNAMTAPTPVSAFLHSAAMVKAGIYLLARFSPVLSGTMLWTALLTSVGAVTMLAAGWLALREVDLKRILAYATVMALGMMTLLLGAGSEEAVKACLIYVLVHACYKAALFMTSGAIQHETGMREVDQMGGLRRMMPATFGVAVVAALSMAGVPLFVGAIGKEHVYKALLTEAPMLFMGDFMSFNYWRDLATLGSGGFLRSVLLSAAVLANVALVAAAGVVSLRPFVGPQAGKQPNHRLAAPSLWIAPAVLSAAGLLFGVAPGLIDGSVMSPAVSATIGHEAHVELHVWEGFTPQFLLGMLTLALGAALYAVIGRVRTTSLLRTLSTWIGTGPDHAYEGGQRLIRAASWKTTAYLQSGLLRRYLMIVFIAAGVLVTSGLLWNTSGLPGADLSGVRFHEWVVAAVILGAAAAVVRVRSRLGVILMLSTVSYGIGLIYLLFGAPDLALTQLLVETLLGILVVLAFVDLPQLHQVSSTRARLTDAAIAVVAGGLVTLLMLTVLEVPFTSATSEYYTTNSYVLAHGRNVVNVILTDFRALDTMGEITVLAVAGSSIFVLLRRRDKDEDDEEVVEP